MTDVDDATAALRDTAGRHRRFPWAPVTLLVALAALALAGFSISQRVDSNDRNAAEAKARADTSANKADEAAGVAVRQKRRINRTNERFNGVLRCLQRESRATVNRCLGRQAIAGAPGERGAIGNSGGPGLPGARGNDGKDGVGVPGRDGINGAPGQGPTAGEILAGVRAYCEVFSCRGPAGKDGAPGAPGPAGPAGPPGASPATELP